MECDYRQQHKVIRNDLLDSLIELRKQELQKGNIGKYKTHFRRHEVRLDGHSVQPEDFRCLLNVSLFLLITSVRVGK